MIPLARPRSQFDTATGRLPATGTERGASETAGSHTDMLLPAETQDGRDSEPLEQPQRLVDALRILAGQGAAPTPHVP
jgi:hypothetical protein